MKQNKTYQSHIRLKAQSIEIEKPKVEFSTIEVKASEIQEIIGKTNGPHVS